MSISIEDVKKSPEYLALEQKISKVSSEIKNLQGQKQYYEAQQLMLARLRSSYNLDDSPANKKITKKEIAEKKKLIASLKTPQQLDIEIKEKIAEFEKLQQDYNTIEIELNPLYVKAVTKYVDEKGTEIRQHPNGKWYIYKSQTAEPQTTITVDEKNIPIAIEAWQANFETKGNVLRTKQKIIVVDKFIEKPKPQRKQHLIFKDLHQATNVFPLSNPDYTPLARQTKENLKKNKGILKRLLK